MKTETTEIPDADDMRNYENWRRKMEESAAALHTIRKMREQKLFAAINEMGKRDVQKQRGIELTDHSESYLRRIGLSAIKAAALGVGLGVGVDGLILLLYWMGLLERLVCK